MNREEILSIAIASGVADCGFSVNDPRMIGLERFYALASILSNKRECGCKVTNLDGLCVECGKEISE